MKTSLMILLIACTILALSASFAGQAAVTTTDVPRYDAKAEATFRGVVAEVRDRRCPVSGGLGSHIIVKLSDGKALEVHLATTKFVNRYELNFRKGDEVEIIGNKVIFEGVETIFAREVHRGQEIFVFRDKKGDPLW